MSLTSVVSLVLIVVGPEFIREAEHFSLVHGGSANDRNFKMSHSIRPTKNDRILTDDSRLVIEPHRKDELEYWLTEHLRLNGLYWGLTALHLLRSPDALPRQETIDFVFACQTESGGFAAAPKHDPHILYTCSAIQILATVDALDEIEKRCQGGKLKIGKWIANLQNKQTGTWAGDEWGEEDTRFLYTAFNALSLLKLLQLADIDKAVEYIISCANFDGGYGTSPGAESHSGQIFACLGALSISKRLETVDKDKLGGWLSERQVECGGLNGRPEKLEDVCYSWWVGCSLTMIDRFHWIDGDKLASFILRCQDAEFGGFADRPGDVVDVFHTLFGLAGLSLLGYPGLDEVNPIYCMPQKIVERVLGPQAEMEM
ncbi:Geranylgeranyl transferase type-2 subunit beta [Golovinomyces cichoracearum]|uniref:Geranylgeranyl transferase type-2 subunit beta n=1 Tax=Golovinomyces cichoracearum TaxID=62708 RepID=A0A420HDW5_9PEZI|nr:Geranylgeranyl transferase type-2 subunit beta [Golovinomyces cichoracearum]